MLVVDYYNKIPFVKSLTAMTSGEIIKYMEAVFAIHVIQKILITDNRK